MGRPATTLQLCQQIHAQLQQEGLLGLSIPRPDWNRFLIQSTGKSINQVENYTLTGEGAGLWTVARGAGRRSGHVVLQPLLEVRPELHPQAIPAQ